ncbi:MAG: 3-phosphoshikimate 1-carboxyvinyltransferase [Fimbriimonadaceae bacterium]|nr:3-phosphoshikimate 1-carboxyvinyltransferase [Fimbriimonadaceae bacterium]
MIRTVFPAESLGGEVRVPADKSLTHRSYLFAALADGPSRVYGPLTGEDCVSTRRCLSALGTEFVDHADGSVGVIPSADWVSPEAPLDCGNSGTTMRLLSGILAGKGIAATLDGDASLSRRPMSRIATPLREMGAEVAGDRPPIRVNARGLRGIEYASPIASAQVKSCVLLAGLYASGTTSVTEPSRSRDHTERMLAAMGAEIEVHGLTATVRSGATLRGFEFHVPGDISSAAFWLVAGALAAGSGIRLPGVNVNPTRTGILDVLAQVGAEVTVSPEPDRLGEPVATLQVRRHARRAFEIRGALVPRLIDEIPVLAVLATQCEGETLIRDASELRVKESDRIAVVADGLARMGATIDARPDGFRIIGPTPLSGTTVDAAGDHRIGMAFSIAGLFARGETTIMNADSIATSYPSFFDDLTRLGGASLDGRSA